MQPVFKFHPIYKERPWGGQAIAGLGSHRSAPEGRKIGESWELSDRPGDESIIAEGEFTGRTIRWLLDEHGEFVMGQPWPKGRRFPLLIKILDCAERLSLQVHPPAAAAAALGGEPKTEMWYLLDAGPNAALMAGLRKGTRREDFEAALRSQTLEKLVHRIPIKKDQAMFIPSGRIHAIDAGCLILEIQQNSDTTYRVYDWGRVGLDGKPRELHIEQSLRCVNFQDFEPALIAPEGSHPGRKTFISCEHFTVISMHATEEESAVEGTAAVHLIDGVVEICSGAEGVTTALGRGETALLSAVPHHIHTRTGRAGVILAYCRGGGTRSPAGSHGPAE